MAECTRPGSVVQVEPAILSLFSSVGSVCSRAVTEIARDTLLWASENERLRSLVPHLPFVRRAVRKFMPGERLDDAVEAARELQARGLPTTLTHLGENVHEKEEAEAATQGYLDALDRIAETGLDSEVSVKLTHLGLDANRDACYGRLRTLVHRAAELGTVVWVDMEESRYVDATLELYRRARAERDAVGVCLQAYLRRTPDDLEALLRVGPAIRLVKGAYNEPADVAFPKKTDVDRQYLTLAVRLLSGAKDGVRAVFGTHDLRIVDAIADAASQRGVKPDGYEVHMLYGIRAREQRALAAAGRKVRVLISYGSAWFAWYMRRLAERPANVWFVLKSLV